MIGIYKITNPIGQVYIGQSINIHKRFISHKYQSKKNKTKIAASIRLYGSDNHIYDILEICDKYLLNERERYWQDLYNSYSDKGLNSMMNTDGNKKGSHSIESINKISESKKGKPGPNKGMKFPNRKKSAFRNSKTILLNMETGIYYFNFKCAAESVNVNPLTLNSYLNGFRKNKTSFIRC